jgi:hypothetical protein
MIDDTGISGSFPAGGVGGDWLSAAAGLPIKLHKGTP